MMVSLQMLISNLICSFKSPAFEKPSHSPSGSVWIMAIGPFSQSDNPIDHKVALCVKEAGTFEV